MCEPELTRSEQSIVPMQIYTALALAKLEFRVRLLVLEVDQTILWLQVASRSQYAASLVRSH